jgi:hypothetical protein
MTAQHNALPQVPNHGETGLAAPKVVTVTYAGYPYDVKGYMSELVQSDWMTAVGADYGVGLGSLAGSIVLDGGPTGGPTTITDPEITDMLAALINDGGIPAPTADTIYMVAFPESTVITAAGGMSCANFGGYHNFFVLDGGTNAVYCVLPTCPAQNGSVLTTEDVLDEDLSHEFIEAATDPAPTNTQAGYDIRDFSNPWSYDYGEVADLCVWAYPYHASDGGLPATRVWSNTAATAGTDPCIPVPSADIYFNVSIDPQTTVYVDAGASDQTITFNVTGWSTASMMAWGAWAVPGPLGTIDPTALNPLLDGTNYPITFNNGDMATMTLTVPGGTASGSYAGVIVYSYTTPNNVDFFGSYNMAAVYVQ